MARILPYVDSATILHSSEAPVYEALKSLSDEYTVLHSYPWLRPLRGEALLEGEADFVVVHQQKGILVLEVKGGDTIRHDGVRWFRDTKSGPREFQDPFEQAKRNMHALLDIIEERSGGRLSRYALVHGYAVVFPQMEYCGDPPNNATHAIVLSCRDLQRIEAAIESALFAWTAGSRHLNHDQYRMLLNDCIMPKFRMFRPIGGDVGNTTAKLTEITETQARIFEGLFSHNRVLVEGVAGSGKTMLAIHRALAFAREGKRTLFLCFNKELAVWLNQLLHDDPTTTDCLQHLTIRNFHGLAADLAREANISFTPEDGGSLTSDFWNNEVPDLIDQSILSLFDRGSKPQYDAVVVDEAQDFSPRWWYSITQALLTNPMGPLYAFMDPNQSLSRDFKPPAVNFDSTFKLTINCRNTRCIAEASSCVIAITTTPFSHSPLGIPIRVLRAPSDVNQRGLVEQEVRSLIRVEGLKPEQIAILGPATKNNGSLSRITDIDGIPVTTSATEWRKGGMILITTARSFKGLEADVVVLYDLGNFSGLFTTSDLYVAVTRAKAHLVAVVHGEECRLALETAKMASEGITK